MHIFIKFAIVSHNLFHVGVFQGKRGSMLAVMKDQKKDYTQIIMWFIFQVCQTFVFQSTKRMTSQHPVSKLKRAGRPESTATSVLNTSVVTKRRRSTVSSGTGSLLLGSTSRFRTSGYGHYMPQVVPTVDGRRYRRYPSSFTASFEWEPELKTSRHG